MHRYSSLNLIVVSIVALQFGLMAANRLSYRPTIGAVGGGAESQGLSLLNVMWLMQASPYLLLISLEVFLCNFTSANLYFQRAAAVAMFTPEVRFARLGSRQ